MKLFVSLLAPGLLVLSLATPVLAQSNEPLTDNGVVFKVDDSGSVVLDPFLELQASPVGRGSAPSAIVSGSTRVSLQLNLAQWLGRSGRIYMTLPRTSSQTVRATWSTGGTLLPGSLLSGDRALVYAGPISEPLLRDVIEIRLEADGTRLNAAESLAFGFEVEFDQ